ncbi:MAG: energy-coupling factor transporter transmembrane protein EcfT [Mycoplasmataceae bacterium]|nr:energy-coupling factor transporter transmembrane protein EcfT [Mycoplasmataceae bacterium]
MNNSFSTYIARESFVHKFNPSLKLIIAVVFIVMIFLPLGFFGQSILLIILITGWLVAKLPAKTMWTIIKSCLVMFFILFLINWMAFKAPGMVFDINHNTQPLFNINFWSTSTNDATGITYKWAHGFIWGADNHYHIQYDKPASGNYLSYVIDKDWTAYMSYNTTWYSLSSETIVYAAYVTCKIYLMIVIVTLTISTTNSVQLSFAIEDILNPLRIFKIPVNEWAMTISIALRFVPSLLEESQKIMRAQASRGVDFRNGNFRDKIKSLVSLVVPMFSIAFHKADGLADAMEARAYNPRYARTRYRNYSIQWQHWLIAGLLTILLGFFIVFSIKRMLFAPFGWTEAVLMYGSR